MFVASEDPEAQDTTALSQEVEKLKENEEFFLGLRKKLELENKDLVEQKDSLTLAKEELSEKVSALMESEQRLRDDVMLARKKVVRCQR